MAGVTEIAIDDDYDLVLEGGDFKLISGADTTAQLIRIALQMVFGELIWNKLVGNKALAAEESPTPQEILAECRRLISEVPGVASVGTLSIEIDEGERIANVTGEALYSDGTTIAVDESVPFGG